MALSQRCDPHSGHTSHFSWRSVNNDTWIEEEEARKKKMRAAGVENEWKDWKKACLTFLSTSPMSMSTCTFDCQLGAQLITLAGTLQVDVAGAATGPLFPQFLDHFLD